MKFYGQFDPPVDRFILERYFPDTSIRGIFVECGAFDGLTDSSCKMFEEFMGWSGYNFEPVPALFAQLEENRPKSKNMMMALSSEEGSVDFRHAVHPALGDFFGNGSVSHADQHIKELEELGCDFQTFSVKTISWKKFVEAEKIPVVDLFVLDVEGHELSVLEGMAGSEVLPHIMCIEFGHLNFSTLRTEMAKLGYEYDIHSQANAYFVRRDVTGLFALRRAQSALDLSNIERHSVSIEEGQAREVAELWKAEQLIEVSLLTRDRIDSAQNAMRIENGKFSHLRLVGLNPQSLRDEDRLYLSIEALSGGEISVVVEHWVNDGVEHRVTEEFSVKQGETILDISLDRASMGAATASVLFVRANGECQVCLTALRKGP